jgi:8-oxo-dGTP diphosphatase
MTGARLWVSGVDESGTELIRRPLPHGMAPEHLLAEGGFTSSGARTVHGQSDPYTLVLEYAVRPALGARPEAREPRRDTGLVVAPGEQPYARQRVAVYSWCHSERGLLLTQFSDRTNAPGQWGPPGGGLDAGELPEPGLHREVYEETGQRVDIQALLGVHDAHWFGRAPSGRLEDFHAVRLIYLAGCPDPSDPVVHDAGGTTLSAVWVPLAQLDERPLAPVWRVILDHHLASGSSRPPATGADRAVPRRPPGPAGPPPR